MFEWICAMFTVSEGCIGLIWLNMFCNSCFDDTRSRISRLERIVERGPVDINLYSVYR